MNFIDKLIASDVAIKISFAAARKICCATTNLEMDDIPYISRVSQSVYVLVKSSYKSAFISFY